MSYGVRWTASLQARIEPADVRDTRMYRDTRNI